MRAPRLLWLVGRLVLQQFRSPWLIFFLGGWVVALTVEQPKSWASVVWVLFEFFPFGIVLLTGEVVALAFPVASGLPIDRRSYWLGALVAGIGVSASFAAVYVYRMRQAVLTLTVDVPTSDWMALSFALCFVALLGTFLWGATRPLTRPWAVLPVVAVVSAGLAGQHAWYVVVASTLFFLAISTYVYVWADWGVHTGKGYRGIRRPLRTAARPSPNRVWRWRAWILVGRPVLRILVIYILAVAATVGAWRSLDGSAALTRLETWQILVLHGVGVAALSAYSARQLFASGAAGGVDAALRWLPEWRGWSAGLGIVALAWGAILAVILGSWSVLAWTCWPEGMSDDMVVLARHGAFFLVVVLLWSLVGVPLEGSSWRRFVFVVLRLAGMFAGLSLPFLASSAIRDAAYYDIETDWWWLAIGAYLLSVLGAWILYLTDPERWIPPNPWRPWRRAHHDVK